MTEGATSCSILVPSLFELDTMARLTPAFFRISTTCLGGTTSQASWL